MLDQALGYVRRAEGYFASVLFLKTIQLKPLLSHPWTEQTYSS